MKVLHSKKVAGLSERVEITYVNLKRQKNQSFSKENTCGKTCGECGKLKVINKKTVKNIPGRRFAFRVRKVEKVEKKAAAWGVMLPRFSGNYFGKNHQKVGKMYN